MNTGSRRGGVKNFHVWRGKEDMFEDDGGLGTKEGQDTTSWGKGVTEVVITGFLLFSGKMEAYNV